MVPLSLLGSVPGPCTAPAGLGNGVPIGASAGFWGSGVFGEGPLDPAGGFTMSMVPLNFGAAAFLRTNAHFEQACAVSEFCVPQFGQNTTHLPRSAVPPLVERSAGPQVELRAIYATQQHSGSGSVGSRELTSRHDTRARWGRWRSAAQAPCRPAQVPPAIPGGVRGRR
jgi:hypothetical protein